MSAVEFRVVRRGFDPDEVNRAISERDAQLAQVRAELARTRDDAASSATLDSQKDKQIADLIGRIEMLEETLAEARATAPRTATFDELGARVAEILNLASAEAEEMVGAARAEATQLVDEATTRSRDLTADANHQAESTVAAAHEEAQRTVAEASSRAEEILEQANADAATRREEAEGVYEAQRAAAAAAAADFERSMAERRTEAMDELDAAIAKKHEEIGVAEDRVLAATHEADEILRVAHQQAETLVRDAENQANAMIIEAKSRAERARQNAEREVAAATARRDSITAQLANVRQMLATLGDPQASLMGATPRTAQEWGDRPESRTGEAISEDVYDAPAEVDTPDEAVADSPAVESATDEADVDAASDADQPAVAAEQQ